MNHSKQVSRHGDLGPGICVSEGKWTKPQRKSSRTIWALSEIQTRNLPDTKQRWYCLSQTEPAISKFKFANYPKYGDIGLHRKVGTVAPNYTASHPRLQQTSYIPPHVAGATQASSCIRERLWVRTGQFAANCLSLHIPGVGISPTGHIGMCRWCGPKWPSVACGTPVRPWLSVWCYCWRDALWPQ